MGNCPGEKVRGIIVVGGISWGWGEAWQLSGWTVVQGEMFEYYKS